MYHHNHSLRRDNNNNNSDNYNEDTTTANNNELDEGKELSSSLSTTTTTTTTTTTRFEKDEKKIANDYNFHCHNKNDDNGASQNKSKNKNKLLFLSLPCLMTVVLSLLLLLVGVGVVGIMISCDKQSHSHAYYQSQASQSSRTQSQTQQSLTQNDNNKNNDNKNHHHHHHHRRKLLSQEDNEDNEEKSSSISMKSLLNKATGRAGGQENNGNNKNDNDNFRVLYVITTLSEYDKGTRGTIHGADRLQNIVIPIIYDAIYTMNIKEGWDVDIYLILGYETLLPERKKLITNILPPGVNLYVWEDAIPYYYKRKKLNIRTIDKTQRIQLASHGLSRQHRYVIKDNIHKYDFFVCFEDDIRITSNHIINFLQLSSNIEELYNKSKKLPGNMMKVPNNNDEQQSNHNHNSKRKRQRQSKATDNASVGNDIINDPISSNFLKRLIPGFIRVEVYDETINNHPLTEQKLSNPQFNNIVPTTNINNVIGGKSFDPNTCCKKIMENNSSTSTSTSSSSKMSSLQNNNNPKVNDLLIWETAIVALGVRKYPNPLGWVGTMPVEDRADVGSYWSGFNPIDPDGNSLYGPKVKRIRRQDIYLAQQAGWMSSQKQIIYYDQEACPGGFLPPYMSEKQWLGDSLQKHAVEFWSGGFQLFGQCYLNRILSLDSNKFSKQLLYHTANNKQRTINTKRFVRAIDLLGQLYTVKNRAEKEILL